MAGDKQHGQQRLSTRLYRNNQSGSVNPSNLRAAYQNAIQGSIKIQDKAQEKMAEFEKIMEVASLCFTSFRRV